MGKGRRRKPAMIRKMMAPNAGVMQGYYHRASSILQEENYVREMIRRIEHLSTRGSGLVDKIMPDPFLAVRDRLRKLREDIPVERSVDVVHKHPVKGVAYKLFFKDNDETIIQEIDANKKTLRRSCTYYAKPQLGFNSRQRAIYMLQNDKVLWSTCVTFDELVVSVAPVPNSPPKAADQDHV